MKTPAKASKHSIRAVINEHNKVYSSVNLKPKDQYRMSIPLLPIRYREPSEVELEHFNGLAKQITERLSTIFPILKGQMEVRHHMGASMYLSLRINNTVLVD